MQQLQVNMLSAEQGLRNASRGEYNFGVASLTSDMRNHFASVVFVASVIKAISAGTRPDQERLLVLEGVADRFPPAAAERQCVFDLQTEIQKLDRGAGGRYVFAKDNVKMAKKGPVTQEVTCKIADIQPGPLSLKLKVRWNQYYKTATNDQPVQHRISQVHQTQSGSSNLIWFHSTLADAEGVGLDCQICVRNLHHRLDGITPIEKVLRPKGQDSLIAIKKSWELTITELADIDLTIQSMPAMTPTIETAHQVDHDMTLHWLALDSFEITSAAPDEHDIPQSQLMERLRQAAFECQAAEVTPDQQLPHILPSRVIEGQPHLAAGEHPTAPVTGGNFDAFHNWSSVNAALAGLGADLQQQRDVIAVIQSHVLEHDEAIDDIIDHICTVPQAPAQHTEQQHSEAQAQQLSTAQAEQHSIPPAQQPKTTAQATVTASSIPSISRNHNASTADSITQQEPTMPTYYTDVHDAMIHTHLPEILDSEADESMNDCIQTPIDNIASEALLHPQQQTPVPTFTDQVLPGIHGPRDPFHMISADDLKEAVLHVLRQKSNLSAMDISRQVWPPPTLAEDDDRSFMKVKVNRALRTLQSDGLLSCQAQLRPPQWSLLNV